MQTQAGSIRYAMSPLPVLVRLSELRTQGPLDQYADLPPLCDESTLETCTLFNQDQSYNT